MRARQAKQRRNRFIALFVLPTFLLTCILMYSIAGVPSQQFSELALAFSHGHLYFLRPIGGLGQDPLLHNGHAYWGEGLFPALVLLPFVAVFQWFHQFFYQGYLHWSFVLGTMYFVYALARRFKYTVEDSLVWMFGFMLGSAFVGVSVVSSGWLFAQVVCTFLLFWSLYEYFTRRRWWLIGVLCGCIFLTRGTAAPIVIFFILELWQGSLKKFRLMPFLPLVVPLASAVAVQALYNYLRFGSPLNGGYEYQLLGTASAESRSLGVFSWRHIPANLYSLVLRGPATEMRTSTSWSLAFPYIRNNANGMSIFITSPYILYLLGRKWAVFSRTARHLLLAAAVSCLAVLCFYGIGRDQFGYRYSLDFLPELFVVLMLVYRAEHDRLTRGMRFLLLAAGIFNFYVLLTYVI